MADANHENAATADHAQMLRDASDAAARAAIPPPPPVPSSDPRLAIVDDKGTSAADDNDLFKLPAVEALRLLSASVELLVRMTGDIPPTPPPKTPTNPQMSGMQVEKDNIVRSHSQQNLARMRQQAERATQQQHACSTNASHEGKEGMNKLQAYSASMSAQLIAQQHDKSGMPTSSEPIDGVKLRHHPQPDVQPYIVVGADSQPVNLQHGAITRKFYSKKEPPIPINQYLLRLHKFCPMSTAVYLATSLYIHRLAVEERAIPVTKRNAHRLVLAGLRVAMKALEDLSYPHAEIAKVGGVSEVELARLEISFCFLAGFELVVGEELLTKHWEELRCGNAQKVLKGMEVPTLKLTKRPREVAQATG
ncbi:cyclin-dependent protein kinase complex component (Pcl8) [Pochonia chlamydosporia 170]|uniref:Cyclin-dependent protein kinase complex component (Pcl8) n=1 Tax=Pochonia chlamydosporia 170 TaxID=1380566 RepID=A0A179FW46_METCM|nr:cyclin-dependent protein kinase complex component (Pcl8) [Pochonia chlamydosporia 170]OAQ69875.1 cyclin-dependent protein kinase complex component (Pcl8) [Pochonia chlamydosporia 170]